MIAELTTALEPCPLPNFVETGFIQDLTYRALAYIEAGFPVHFRGTSGIGKTTLAMHVAGKLGRPVVLIHGDAEFTTSDLVGGENGYRMRKVIDRFVSRVLKVEEDMTKRWVDNRLTVACKYGFTLIYDEFTRSRPEANNVLLSVLQEGVMDMPANRCGEDNYLQVHPDFRAIFTSNPEEYAGVHRSQDALRDRMVTMDLDYFDEETEVVITKAKSGLPHKEVEKIVKIVRALRESGKCDFGPTPRGSIMIAKTLNVLNVPVRANNVVFRDICQDVLASETCRDRNKSIQSDIKAILDTLINQFS
ncbi:MAG: gas vesicle protein GvpN [Acidobacteria bacterium]|nr:gas vesicle protein GvpN [Acidobacteriota bacterium]MBI3654842.1 gas vesicle protein GvpN [Acidobacteriota bacterium]